MYGQLPALAGLARAVPDTLVIANHLGVPIYRPAEDRREEVMEIWRGNMRALAACPNVVVKIGGIGMDRMFGTGWSTREQPPGSDEVAAWWGDDIHHCIALFGPARCMFESNFPVDGESLGYTVLWNAFQKIAARYSDDEQDALFAGTARRAYRLPG
jgi:L-fuconolactonase